MRVARKHVESEPVRDDLEQDGREFVVTGIREATHQDAPFQAANAAVSRQPAAASGPGGSHPPATRHGRVPGTTVCHRRQPYSPGR